MRLLVLLVVSGLILSSSGGGAEGAPREAEVVFCGEVDRVWAGHSVGFDFKLHGDRLYAAYYDARRRMTVATTPLDAIAWTRRTLPSELGWDSHNYVTFAFDAADNLHLSGNIHAQPLIYFRTQRPLDLATLERMPSMVGERERTCTYPQFMQGPGGELIFHYRDGVSGNGDEIYNVFDARTGRWTRLLDTALSDGKGLMNAYFVGPVAGPDGFYHLTWVWRDTPMCETCHDLSYMRSRDLRHWETAAGRPVALPVSIDTPGLVVDPTPARGGLINMGTDIGFDAERRPVITYHKYDERGASQIYNARWEGTGWRRVRMTDWTRRWEFSGPGSVACRVQGGELRRVEDGRFVQTFYSDFEGNASWVIDGRTLARVERYAAPRRDRMPKGWGRVEGTFPGLARSVRHVARPGTNLHYYLVWETLGANRDRPRPKPWPEPSKLTLWVLKGNL